MLSLFDFKITFAICVLLVVICFAITLYTGNLGFLAIGFTGLLLVVIVGTSLLPTGGPHNHRSHHAHSLSMTNMHSRRLGTG